MATIATRQLLPDGNGHGLTHFTKKLLNNICDFYDEQDLIDVTFKLFNPTAIIPAHRLILSAASPYFKDLFKSDKGLTPVIELNNIDSDTFELLIAFCYTGKTLITIDNVGVMLKAAMYLKLDDAVVSCVDYILQHITEYTLQRAHWLERETHCVPLYEKLLEYEINNFMEISQTPDFLRFEAEKLQAIIESNNLNVTCEEDTFHAIKRWYEHDTSVRQQQLPDLISRLRLTHFDTKFLLTNVKTLPGCELLAFKAISWITLPSDRTKISLKFTAPMENTICENSEELTLIAVQAYDSKGTIFKYDEPEDECHKYAEVQHDTVAYGMALMEDNIIYIGGKRNGNITNGVKSWSLKTRTWRALPSMIHPRSWPNVVLLNNSIYVMGGEVTNGQPRRSVEMYSPGGGWKLVSSMITPRSLAGTVALNGKIFVMGGFDGTYNSQTVECYDPSSNTWTLCEDMNKAHNFPSVAVHNDYIYVLGGISENRTVERYDPQSNECTTVCYLNVGRGCMGCVVKGDQLWVVGGDHNDKMKNHVSVYYAEYNKWFKRKPIPIADRYSCYVVPRALL